MAEWSGTEAALGGFLERHGEHPRPHYPIAALYHAGLWDLGGPRPVPPAHGNAPLHWFASNQPAGGLPAPVYNLVRYSGEARVAAVATIADKYLQDADDDAILADAGLADADIADDEVPADAHRHRLQLDLPRMDHRPARPRPQILDHHRRHSGNAAAPRASSPPERCRTIPTEPGRPRACSARSSADAWPTPRGRSRRPGRWRPEPARGCGGPFRAAAQRRRRRLSSRTPAARR